MNPKRAMLNVHRAPTTARFKEHMMTRWRGAAFDSSDGAKDFLKDLSRRMHAAKFTPEEREAATKVKAGVRRPGRPSKRAASAAEKRGARAGDPTEQLRPSALLVYTRAFDTLSFLLALNSQGSGLDVPGAFDTLYGVHKAV